MKKFIQEQLRKALLVEGISDIAYHFTYNNKLVNIAKENKFHASTNIGSSADLNTSSGRFFFFSTTRSLSSGYSQGNVRFKLDGRKLKDKYKSVAVDYWQYSKKAEDWGDTENDPRARSSYRQALASNEQEDRLVLNEPTIENAFKYILSVDVYVEPQFYTKEDIEFMQNTFKNEGIPIHFYSDIRHYNAGRPEKAIDPNTLDGYRTQSETYESTNYYDVYKVVPMIVFGNEDRIPEMINGMGIQNDEEQVTQLKRMLDSDLYRLNSDAKRGYGVDERDMAVIINYIHNIRTKTSQPARFVMKTLANDMRRLRAKNIQQYMDIKFGLIEKPKTTRTSKGTLINHGEVVEWDKLAWNWMNIDEFWNALPENLQDDMNLVELVNNENATLSYVYNLLMKLSNKNVTLSVFKACDMEIQN